MQWRKREKQSCEGSDGTAEGFTGTEGSFFVSEDSGEGYSEKGNVGDGVQVSGATLVKHPETLLTG